MGMNTPRPSLDLTLLEGPRLAAAVARVAPWTTPWRVALVAVAGGSAIAANVTAFSPRWHDLGLLKLLVLAAWVLAGIVLRELARAAMAARLGHAPVALRVALDRRRLPAFHLELQPGWALMSPDRRGRITATGCGLQLGLAGALALVSPLWGGDAWLSAALVTAGMALWTAVTGQRGFLARPPAMRGALVARIETAPLEATRQHPQTAETAGDRPPPL